ncbi:CCA-adding enzyme [Paenibacillus baekrokdamisoli]|uniref:CCA-adding enzyme n=1 Tax=Paenibacillus baekrokdamisoli TaxID=1712516 RepID=A0A3G9JAT6_9BACL|nr:CCA tRNA nucleotidyltransferase [Paenibacillus baekrokdamisoli]MBB3069688.1 tRNA nucleotidyltransferase (CCA-adding enzyme) [Paenibacillus baekrokdamisoli]BBH20958.1 CCA-adding enzyme [Paenibacillus baekrokdamisoli]
MKEALRLALPVLQKLESQGYEAVFVGGCVRDTIMGRTLHDVDIATSATPEQVIASFPRTIPTGLQHGTITVIHGAETYEVTTYRTETAYEQFRRPAQVQFVTEHEADLLRRDFTINAMAMRADGTVVDPFGGMQDLQDRIIRCVGDADARLQEDALRMVRAIRFASEFNMRIAPQTWRALKQHSSLLVHVAMERVGAEADKMIGGSSPIRAIAWMAASGLLKYTKRQLPERIVQAAGEYERKRIHAVPIFEQLNKLDQIDDRWAGLCMGLGLGADEAFRLFDAFRFSTVRTQHLKTVMQVENDMQQALHSYQPMNSSDSLDLSQSDQLLFQTWMETILTYGKDAAASWLRTAAKTTGSNAAMDKLDDWLQTLPLSTVRDLAIGGADILALLQKPSGPWLGQLLNELLRSVVFGEVPNDKKRLLAEAARRQT